MKFLNWLSGFLGKYFVGMVLLVVAIAMIKPEIFLTIGKFRPLGQSVVTVGLAIIMFVMGLTLDTESFKIVFSRPKDVFVGCLAQFTVMPLVAFLLAKLFNLSPELAVGLVLLGTCPGGTASNVMTYLAKGDVALSVGMTSVSTLLAPLLTPVLTFLLAGQWVKVDMMAMVIDIVKVVILPIFLGVVIHKLLGNKIKKFSNALVIVPVLTIILIIGLCVAPNKANLMKSGGLLVMAVCLHNWIGFALGYVIGYFTGMSDDKKKAISIEVGLQNSGLAVGLSAQFGNPLCTLPAAVATVTHQISGSLLANLFSGNLSFNFLKKRKKAKVKA